MSQQWGVLGPGLAVTPQRKETMLSCYMISGVAVRRKMCKDSSVTVLAFVVFMYTSCLLWCVFWDFFPTFLDNFLYLSCNGTSAQNTWLATGGFPFYINCLSSSTNGNVGDMWQELKELSSTTGLAVSTEWTSKTKTEMERPNSVIKIRKKRSYCTWTLRVKVKVKVSLEQATKAQRGSRGIAVLFLQPRR